MPSSGGRKTKGRSGARKPRKSATKARSKAGTKKKPAVSRSQETRYVDLHEGDTLDEAQMATWVKQAAALPGWVP